VGCDGKQQQMMVKDGKQWQRTAKDSKGQQMMAMMANNSK